MNPDISSLALPSSSRLAGIASAARATFWSVAVLLLAQQACAPAQVRAARDLVLQQLQDERGSRVISMIHRQDTVSVLGVPVSTSIGIEDSEAVLRAIRETPPDQPIDFILHTPGGLVLAAEQIAHALVQHPARVTVFVPHYAMSGGTLIALAAEEIVMDPNAVLGPVDPQIGDMPAASIVKAVKEKRPDAVSDETLVLADIAEKAQLQVTAFVMDVLRKRLPPDRAQTLALTLSEGRWTHDFPITVEKARALGLPVTTSMPPSIYELMDLYPQGGAGRPSVSYVPLSPRTPVGSR